MSLAGAVGDSLAQASGTIAATILVPAEPGRAGETVERLRAAQGAMVLLLIESSISPLDRAMLIAAIGPLAIERAPHGRIGALDVAAGAAPEDVVAAARFLAAAGSTTGQVLKIS